MAGVRVDLDGARRPGRGATDLPDGVQLSAYQHRAGGAHQRGPATPGRPTAGVLVAAGGGRRGTRCEVADDGHGADRTRAPSNGLVGMRERIEEVGGG